MEDEDISKAITIPSISSEAYDLFKFIESNATQIDGQTGSFKYSELINIAQKGDFNLEPYLFAVRYYEDKMLEVKND